MNRRVFKWCGHEINEFVEVQRKLQSVTKFEDLAISGIFVYEKSGGVFVNPRYFG